MVEEAKSIAPAVLTCIPGVIQYRGNKLQFLDSPSIVEGAKDVKGKGIGFARTCNLILVVLDTVKPLSWLSYKWIIENELEGVGIRLNRKKPDIGIRKW